MGSTTGKIKGKTNEDIGTAKQSLNLRAQYRQPTAQYDLGSPKTFSPMKLRMSCGLIGAMRGIITSRK
jgi:hypothetical protein